jgi:hypothetical protein
MMGLIKNAYRKMEWYVNAKPYRYILYSMIFNAFESIMLIWIALKIM